MADLAERRRSFRRLHESGCFVIPNPWDVGSARLLAGMGFRALATTSGGFAFSRGLPDGAVGRDEMLAHIAAVVAATDLPVNADFQAGYADDPSGVAENVRRCVQTGVAGLSIEDMKRDHALYELELAVDRVRAARSAIDASGADVLLTARCESFLVRHATPLPEACRRLAAFAAAGADVLFAPASLDEDAIAAIVAAVAPKPINVIAFPKHGSIAALAALGVRRVSLASGLARAALGGFLRAAREIADGGTFGGLQSAEPVADLNRFFANREWVK
jgi:2-methylisocitrate lyase-like PEP mutase family enzyme